VPQSHDKVVVFGAGPIGLSLRSHRRPDRELEKYGVTINQPILYDEVGDALRITSSPGAARQGRRHVQPRGDL